MLAAHKIVDALKRKPGRKYGVFRIPGIMQADLDKVADLIEVAEKFDFGDLVLEQAKGYEGTALEGSFIVPSLTATEREFWRDGLLPLPSHCVWYEFVISGFRSGILAFVDPDIPRVVYLHRLDIVDDEVTFDGVVLRHDQTTIGEVHEDHVMQAEVSFASEETRDFLRDSGVPAEAAGASLGLMIYMTLMLNSRTSEKLDFAAPRKLNAKRIKRGVTPLYSHTIVDIVPKRFRYAQSGGSGIHRQSPRLHWRRSHLRHLPSGKAVVIPRFLVGKAELGEVSHEYRVQQEKETA